MLGSLPLLCAVLASPAVFGSPVQARASYAVKERHYLPRQWKHVSRASRDHVLALKIGVKQGDFEQLERHLYEVSDPDHPRYGKHLSSQDVIDLVQPKDETLELVHSWLQENGVEPRHLTYSPAKDWIELSLPVDEAERLLDTEYQVYEHDDGTRLVRTLDWSLPRHLHEHIDTIQPTTSFLRSSPQRSTYLDLKPTVPEGYTPPSDPTIAKVCNITSVTPECFMHLYKTLGYKVKSANKNSIAFNNFLGEIPIRPDTAKFAAKYRPDAVGQANSFPQYSIAKGPVQDGPLTLNQSKEGISREGQSRRGSPPFIPDLFTKENTNEPYLDWLNYVLALDKIPPVISTSYADDEQTVPIDYARRVCRQFASLGARGVSVLFASGDSGVGANGTCFSNDGKNTTMFVPVFPPSCPYVTVVGATHEFQPEVVAYRGPTIVNGTVKRTVYSSGGGFGNYFATPDYQADVVSEYIDDLDGEFDGLYNKSGRAYPDIAAQGQFFAYFWNGTEGSISGTSASTPLMSGIIALVNDARIAVGKPPLGFLNPWIYKKGYEGFTDITSGSAVGCESRGFPAVEGWDAVTGFGTPIFPELLELAGAKW